jgi:hypothetical protein
MYIKEVVIGDDGAVVLTDEQLSEMAAVPGHHVAGGANENCSNPNCKGSTNEVCRNTLQCGVNDNTHCTNSAPGCKDKLSPELPW